MQRAVAFLFAVFLVPTAGRTDEQVSPPDLRKVPGLVDVKPLIPMLQVELKYSTTDNFMHQDVYGDLERCYLQKDAAEMLRKAAEHLAAMRPDLRLRAYDCVRPVRVQRLMWAVVRGTAQQAYVANPNTPTGSIHNYGCAVDLTLATASGTPVDMGTPFDFFGKAAQPRLELDLYRSGRLTGEQWANRLLLREVMVRAGFLPIPSEWWHFNCAPNAVVRKRYQQVP